MWSDRLIKIFVFLKIDFAFLNFNLFLHNRFRFFSARSCILVFIKARGVELRNVFARIFSDRFVLYRNLLGQRFRIRNDIGNFGAFFINAFLVFNRYRLSQSVIYPIQHRRALVKIFLFVFRRQRHDGAFTQGDFRGLLDSQAHVLDFFFGEKGLLIFNPRFFWRFALNRGIRRNLEFCFSRTKNIVRNFGFRLSLFYGCFLLLSRWAENIFRDILSFWHGRLGLFGFLPRLAKNIIWNILFGFILPWFGFGCFDIALDGRQVRGAFVFGWLCLGHLDQRLFRLSDQRFFGFLDYRFRDQSTFQLGLFWNFGSNFFARLRCALFCFWRLSCNGFWLGWRGSGFWFGWCWFCLVRLFREIALEQIRHLDRRFLLCGRRGTPLKFVRVDITYDHWQRQCNRAVFREFGIDIIARHAGHEIFDGCFHFAGSKFLVKILDNDFHFFVRDLVRHIKSIRQQFHHFGQRDVHRLQPTGCLFRGSVIIRGGKQFFNFHDALQHLIHFHVILRRFGNRGLFY